jgi:hypothetical protein
MSAAQRRLVLAFDASCGKCREISAAVERACDGRLEVLPLTHGDVRRWREEWFDGDAPWAPTLIRVDGDAVRVWTGRGMALPLVRGLGPRSTVRVLRALGELNTKAEAGPGTLGRKQFFKLAAGAAVAAGMVFAGNSPAAAESAGTKARAWVAANRGRLPQRYAQLAVLPIEHRRAVFQASTPELRTAFWLDHIDQFRTTRPDLTARQVAIVDRARALAPKVFADGPHAHAAAMSALKEDAISKLGFTEARALLATLGPVEDRAAGTVADECECANFDPWCLSFLVCTNWPIGCSPTDGGCGDFWIWDCDGVCQFPV